jgi:hypothetical protein
MKLTMVYNMLVFFLMSFAFASASVFAADTDSTEIAQEAFEQMSATLQSITYHYIELNEQLASLSSTLEAHTTSSRICLKAFDLGARISSLAQDHPALITKDMIIGLADLDAQCHAINLSPQDQPSRSILLETLRNLMRLDDTGNHVVPPELRLVILQIQAKLLLLSTEAEHGQEAIEEMRKEAKVGEEEKNWYTEPASGTTVVVTLASCFLIDCAIINCYVLLSQRGRAAVRN